MLGIGLRVLSGLLVAAMVVSVKAVSEKVPLGEIVFFRSFFAMIPLVFFVWIRREFPGGLATKRPGAHFLRSGFGALALLASFASIAPLNLAEATLIAQLTPVLTAFAAMILLSERLIIWRVGGLALGFSGVIVLVSPELGGGSNDTARLVWYALGLASAVLSALSLVLIRSLNGTESPGAIALYFVLASMIGALLTIPWGWVAPEGQTLSLLIAAGLFGGFGHIAMTLAFRYAEASRLAPFEYVALLRPLLADLFVFNLRLSTAFLVAAPLILFGAVVAAAEGKRKGTR
ncbi:MAG: DMT family transporter [Rhodobacter sp.]|nr:DMT family transporter [Rhodobacter sp.]